MYLSVIMCASLSGDRYLGAGDTDRREILHNFRAVSRTELLPFGGDILGAANAGSRKGDGVGRFGPLESGLNAKR